MTTLRKRKIRTEENPEKASSDSSEPDKISESEQVEDDDSSDDERGEIRNELSTMSFEQLIKLKDELGTKVYNEAVFGKSSKTSSTRQSQNDFKRANKNRPREMSSKRPVPFLGNAETSQTFESRKPRDPRFDEKCGEYDSKIFKTNYEFVNDIREKDIRDLRRKLKKASNDERKEIKLLIQRLENQIREEKKRKAKDEDLKQEKDEMRKAKEEGRPAWHKTNKERKLTELVKQYDDLKKTGKLSKHLEKRRKKNASKDRKKFSVS